MMRVKLTLSLMTLFFVGSIAFIPTMILSRVTRVELAPVMTQIYQNMVNCNGEIIEKGMRQIYLEAPVIASDVRVQVGDRVQRGQTLATINTGLTQRVLSQGSAPKAQSKANTAIPIEASALAASYGLSTSDVAAAMGRYSGGSTVAEGSAHFVPSVITAPISGIVTEINLQTDVLTQTARPVLTISDDSSYAACVAVNEADISQISLGDAVELTGVGFYGQSYTGTVARVYPVARKALIGTTQQTVVDVEITISDADWALKPGFSVKAAITTQVGGEILTVPYEAVSQDADNREFVYIYHDSHVQKRYIETDLELVDAVSVTEGLTMADWVVLSPDAVPDDAGLVLPVTQEGGAG